MDEETLQVTIDVDALTIGDLEILEKLGQRMDTSELFKLLDRVVVGEYRHLPLGELKRIADAIGDAVGELGGAGN